MTIRIEIWECVCESLGVLRVQNFPVLEYALGKTQTGDSWSDMCLFSRMLSVSHAYTLISCPPFWSPFGFFTLFWTPAFPPGICLQI